MKMKNCGLSSSPYSRMYMVTPTIYKKMLTCLNELEKKETMELNNENEGIETSTNSVNEVQPPESTFQQIENTIPGPSNNPEIIDPNPGVIENNVLKQPCIETGDIPDATQRQVLLKQEKKFSCLICGKKFTRNWGLKRHQAQFHRATFSPQEIQNEDVDFEDWENMPLAQVKQNNIGFRPPGPEPYNNFDYDMAENLPLSTVRDMKKLNRSASSWENLPLSKIRQLRDMQKFYSRNPQNWENIPLSRVRTLRKNIKGVNNPAKNYQTPNTLGMDFDTWEETPLATVRDMRKLESNANSWENMPLSRVKNLRNKMSKNNTLSKVLKRLKRPEINPKKLSGNLLPINRGYVEDYEAPIPSTPTRKINKRRLDSDDESDYGAQKIRYVLDNKRTSTAARLPLPRPKKTTADFESWTF